MNNRFHNPSNNPANQNRQTSAGRAQSNHSQADNADRLTPNISAEKEQELLNAASRWDKARTGSNRLCKTARSSRCSKTCRPSRRRRWRVS